MTTLITLFGAVVALVFGAHLVGPECAIGAVLIFCSGSLFTHVGRDAQDKIDREKKIVK